MTEHKCSDFATCHPNAELEARAKERDEAADKKVPPEVVAEVQAEIDAKDALINDDIDELHRIRNELFVSRPAYRTPGEKAAEELHGAAVRLAKGLNYNADTIQRLAQDMHDLRDMYEQQRRKLKKKNRKLRKKAQKLEKRLYY